jgi:hypothetical protein
MDQPRTALGLILIALDSSDPEAPPAPAPDLDPILQGAIASGIMTEAQARDLDAFADGLVARGRAGELTEEQASELARAAAQRDGEAVNRARARRRSK